MKTVFHPTLPATQEVADEDLDDWLEQGWLEEAPAGVDPDFDQLASAIPVVMEHVGSDAARISEALELEKARGDAARPSLIKQLEKLNTEGQI